MDTSVTANKRRPVLKAGDNIRQDETSLFHLEVSKDTTYIGVVYDPGDGGRRPMHMVVARAQRTKPDEYNVLEIIYQGPEDMSLNGHEEVAARIPYMYMPALAVHEDDRIKRVALRRLAAGA